MMQNTQKYFCLLVLIVMLFSSFLLSACVNTKGVTYFNNIPNSILTDSAYSLDPIIQKGDLLSISVTSLSPDVTTIFNAPNTPVTNFNSSNNSLTQPAGYLVSQQGYIDFPMLGSIMAEGLSKSGLKETITKELEDKKLLFDPIVTVRYLNFHVTILGEVNNPGVITIPNEQVTLLEALGMAGDLTIYGKRDNVLLLRKNGSQKLVHRLDLTSEKILTSPYFYLKSNDVVYVQPGKNKLASVSQSRQLLPIIFSGLSLLAIIIDRIWK